MRSSLRHRGKALLHAVKLTAQYLYCSLAGERENHRLKGRNTSVDRHKRCSTVAPVIVAFNRLFLLLDKGALDVLYSEECDSQQRHVSGFSACHT